MRLFKDSSFFRLIDLFWLSNKQVLNACLFTGIRFNILGDAFPPVKVVFLWK